MDAEGLSKFRHIATTLLESDFPKTAAESLLASIVLTLIDDVEKQKEQS